MHNIEPFYLWKEIYDSAEDKKSPFYGRVYNEFFFSNTVYNYYIHPQWDEFGSNTLYAKILFCDYKSGFSIIELIGEWNDCLYNDIMYLMENIVNHLMNHQIYKFMIICENVLNFHGSDNSYYEAWYEAVAEENGWIILTNLLEHVEKEMQSTRLHDYVWMVNDIPWRKIKPNHMSEYLSAKLSQLTREI